MRVVICRDLVLNNGSVIRQYLHRDGGKPRKVVHPVNMSHTYSADGAVHWSSNEREDTMVVVEDDERLTEFIMLMEDSCREGGWEIGFAPVESVPSGRFRGPCLPPR